MRTSRTLISAIGEKFDVLFNCHSSINSNKALANALSIAPANISQWRCGVLARGVSPGNIPKSRLKEIACLFGIHDEWFNKELNEFTECVFQHYKITAKIPKASQSYSFVRETDLSNNASIDINEHCGTQTLTYLIINIRPVNNDILTITKKTNLASELSIVDTIAKKHGGLLLKHNCSLQTMINQLTIFGYDWLFCFGYAGQEESAANQAIETAIKLSKTLPGIIDISHHTRSLIITANDQMNSLNENTIISNPLVKKLSSQCVDHLPKNSTVIDQMTLSMLRNDYRIKSLQPTENSLAVSSQLSTALPLWQVLA